jgi:ATP-dependent protease ClpP protease subunit
MKRNIVVSLLLLISLSILIGIAIMSSDFEGVKPLKIITLEENNIINLRGSITKDNIDDTLIRYDSLKTRNPNGDIFLVIESRGGDAEEGLRFIDHLKSDHHLSVIIIKASSMASAIVEQLPGRRYIVKTGEMMFHRGGHFPTMTVSDKLDIPNSTRLNLSLNEYRQRIMTEWYMDANEAILYNAADEIVIIKCGFSLQDASETIYFPHPNGLVQAIPTSKCPLVTQPVEPKE